MSSDVVKSDGTRQIQIGENLYTIRRFKGLKATLAGALISRVMREFPDLQEKAFSYRKSFRENNTIKITPAMAKMPRFAPLGLTTEDFQAVGGNIEFPEDPDQGAILVHVFPQLFEVAKVELQRFFALLVISNSDLEAADDADEVEEILDKVGKRVIREGDIDELLDLIVTGVEVFQEQMSGKSDRLGKLNLPWLNALTRPPEKETETSESENSGPGQTSPILDDEAQSPPKSSAPPSFSDAVDGDLAEETLSTEPLGASSS